jgi:uncharacterized protein YggE
MRLPIAAAMFLAATPAVAADVTIAVQGPVIELTVNQAVSGDPDIVSLGAGVVAKAPTAMEAARINADRMAKVIAELKKQGVAVADIQTRDYSVQPQFTYNRDNTPPTFNGYQVENHVWAKLRNVAKTGPVLDALIAAGANSIDGPAFELENDTAAKSAARKAAFAAAGARAKEIAALAGYTSVRLLEVSETIAPRRAFAKDEIMVTGSRVGATPIEAGQVESGVTLTVKYEMTR